MKTYLNMDRIARALGAKRGGSVRASSGYFGAAELASEIKHRLHIPTSGGRPTDPRWTERRLVGLTPETLKRLQVLAAQTSKVLHVRIDPMQAAAIILEKALRDTRRAQLLAQDLVAETKGSYRRKVRAIKINNLEGLE